MKQNHNILILFFTLIVVMLGFGIIIPILPFYVRHFNAGGSAMGGLMATYGVTQFIFAPIWGSISDRVGRKPVLMIGVLGNALAQLLMGLSTSLWMLFAARALAGILSSATLPTAMAYISDSTTEAKRSGQMGMVGAAMGVGMVIGPGLGGWLAGNSLSLPFFLASALSLLALLLIFIMLPESHQRQLSADRSIHGPQIKELWQALFGPLGILYFMSFLLTFGLTNFEGVFGLYAQTRYHYDSRQVGFLLMLIGVISAAVQGGATGPLTRRFGDINIIRGALFFSAVGFFLMTLAVTDQSVYLTTSFFILSNAMLNPTVASLISKRTASGQGITMGVNNSFLSLGRIAGPLWAGSMFDISINLPYFSGAAIMLAGFIISLIWLAHVSTSTAAKQPSPIPDVPQATG